MDVVDEAQLRRIEATHKGFLYQHLYAVACLLMAARLGWTRMRVEADEDLELEFSGRYVYVQVKSRSKPIQHSDIESALQRFDQYRALHVQGARSGQPEFILALNQELSPTLNERFERGEFSRDIRILRPSDSYPGFPPVWADSEIAFRWCVTQAEMLPFVMIAPDVLVQNLAGVIMRVAAGLDEFKLHEISATRAYSMLEQFLQQIHEFPTPPLNYRPQDDEPSLTSNLPIRLIAGFSGAGKTSWAAQAALADTELRAYFDVADLPSLSLARAIARELAARWLGNNTTVRQAVANSAITGLEALQTVTSSLSGQQQHYTLVIDNAHRIRIEDARLIASAMNNLRVVFLAQPTEELGSLSAALNVEPETLQGWGADSIGNEASSLECPISMATAIRIRSLTAGLPLYVRSAISVAKSDYASDLAAFCDAFENQLLSNDTRQHTLLTAVVNTLDETSRQTLACVSLSDVPLAGEEITSVVAKAFSLEPTLVMRKLRALRARGLVQAYGSQRSKAHDAVRPIALEYMIEHADAGRRARETLRDLVEKSFQDDSDRERFPLFIRLLVDLKDVASLADICTQEFFYEGPDYPQIWPLLEEGARNQELPLTVRFDCLDALVYSSQKNSPETSVEPLLNRMEELLDGGLDEDRPRLVFLLKTLLHWAHLGDAIQVSELLERARKKLPRNPSYRRVFNYNAAYALWKIHMPARAEKILDALVAEYFDALDIDPKTLISNPDLYVERSRIEEDFGSDCKHLADCFDLLSRVLDSLRRPRTDPRQLAVRLFEISGSWDSAVRVGIDLIYQYLDRNDLQRALTLASEYLPQIARKYGLARHTIPLRYLHAHILGQLGEIAAAREILHSADPFFETLAEDEKAEAIRITNHLR